MAAAKGRTRAGPKARKGATARRKAPSGQKRARAAKGSGARAPAKKPRAQSSKKRATPRRRAARKARPQPRPDFVIVEDNLGFDAQKENAERRAYLEEARSQDVSD